MGDHAMDRSSYEDAVRSGSEIDRIIEHAQAVRSGSLKAASAVASSLMHAAVIAPERLADAPNAAPVQDAPFMIISELGIIKPACSLGQIFSRHKESITECTGREMFLLARAVHQGEVLRAPVLQGEQVPARIAAHCKEIGIKWTGRPRAHPVEDQPVGEVVGKSVGPVVIMGRVGGIPIQGIVVGGVEPVFVRSLPESARRTVSQRGGPVPIPVGKIIKRKIILKQTEVIGVGEIKAAAGCASFPGTAALHVEIDESAHGGPFGGSHIRASFRIKEIAR